jgi:hypothetical protein
MDVYGPYPVTWLSCLSHSVFPYFCEPYTMHIAARSRGEATLAIRWGGGTVIRFRNPAKRLDKVPVLTPGSELRPLCSHIAASRAASPYRAEYKQRCRHHEEIHDRSDQEDGVPSTGLRLQHVR